MDILHLLQLAIVLVVSFGSSTTTGLPLLTPHPEVTNRLLSAATGKYVSITKSGRVHGNGEINHKNPGKLIMNILLFEVCAYYTTCTCKV